MILQRLTRRLRVFLPVLLTLLWALTATSQAAATRWHYAWRPGWLPGDPSVADQNQTAPIWAPEAIQSAGMFIAIDPVTHIPTAPSDAQKRAFAAQAERDALLAPTRPLQVEKLPGGGELIHLNGQFQVYSIARRDAQGHVRTDCVPDPSTARKLLSEPAPSSTTWEEK